MKKTTTSKTKKFTDTLTLNMKGEWYKMIESGFKKEEYREIKPYWVKRLCINPVLKETTFSYEGFVPYKFIKFVYGYTDRSMTFECDGIYFGGGNPEWGGYGEGEDELFCIKIGKRVC